jgi:hypothetical protein
LGRFREHGILIYLSKDLYSGFIRLQADRNLGRSYAALLSFVEGLFRMGYISKEVYEEHGKKYSSPLESEKPLSLEQSKEKQFLEQKDRQFKGILEQWNFPRENIEEWRKKACVFAKKYADKLQSAKDILALKEGGAQA